MTLKLHNSIPKDPYTKQLCCTKWYRSEEISPVVTAGGSVKFLCYTRYSLPLLAQTSLLVWISVALDFWEPLN